MKIPNSLTRAVNRQLLVGRKHSPHIMFAGGVVAVIGSAALACKATLKVEKKLDDFKHEIDQNKKDFYNPQFIMHREYSQMDQRRDLAFIYAKNTAGIAKLYAPALVVGVVGVGLLTGSHVTLTKRNAALTAAYTGLAESFAAYRKRVTDEVGEEKEQQLYSGVEMITDKKTGEVVMKVTDPSAKLSPYARWFDASNPNWAKTPDQNRYYIELQQMYLNDRLKARGHVFLNEVYDELGLSHTKEGAVVGWIWPAREGCDGHIDCGIYASRQEFHIGQEYQILLDFNVDGLIWDKI